MSARGAKKARGNLMSSTSERREGSAVRMSARGAKKARGNLMSSTFRLPKETLDS